MNWNLRTCARRGHVLYSPDEPAARAVVHAAAPAGDLWRCLRCGEFTAAAGPVPAGPVAQVPVVSRGRELRDRFVMRLLAAERLVRGVLMALLAAGAWRFHDSQHQLRADLVNLVPHLHAAAGWLGVDLTRTGLFHLADELLNVQPKMVLYAGLGLLGYGLVELCEGVGLWLGHRWGEYVAVVGTSAFIPLELHEVLASASAVKAGTLAINVAAVVWLVYNGRLFGMRGGHHAYVAARRGAAVLDPDDYPTPSTDPANPRPDLDAAGVAGAASRRHSEPTDS